MRRDKQHVSNRVKTPNPFIPLSRTLLRLLNNIFRNLNVQESVRKDLGYRRPGLNLVYFNSSSLETLGRVGHNEILPTTIYKGSAI